MFPVVLIVTVALVFAGLFAGVQSTALSVAGLAAERAAFVWDNSKRNPVTGGFYPGQHDELYWRLTSDFPSSALTRRKLDAALGSVGPAAGKEVRYENAVWRRKVSAELTAAFHAPHFLPLIGGPDGTVQRAEAIVTDPAEWVRQVAMAKLYWPVIRDAVTPDQAERIVDEFRKRPGAEREQLAFGHHDDAVAYLRQLTGGRLKDIKTESVGHYRRIEAYDANGVAHHALLGGKTDDSSMRFQYEKDEELLGKGLVKGAVWHFFRNERTGQIGPSDKLRRELERRGIVIVIHE